MKKAGKGVSVAENTDTGEMDKVLDRLESIVVRLEEMIAIPPEEEKGGEEIDKVFEKKEKVWVKLGKEEVKARIVKVNGKKATVKIKDKEHKKFNKKVKVKLTAIRER